MRKYVTFEETTKHTQTRTHKQSWVRVTAMHYQLSFNDPTGGRHQIMKTQLFGKPLLYRQLIN